MQQSITTKYDSFLPGSHTMLRMKAKVGQKGQAVIPKPIRDELGIKPGDEVVYWMEGDEVHVGRAGDADDITRALESLPRFSLPPDLDVDEEVDRAMDEGW